MLASGQSIIDLQVLTSAHVFDHVSLRIEPLVAQLALVGQLASVQTEVDC